MRRKVVDGRNVWKLFLKLEYKLEFEFSSFFIEFFLFLKKGVIIFFVVF